MCEWVIERNVGWAAPHFRLPDKGVTLPLNHCMAYIRHKPKPALYMSIFPVTERHWVSHWQKLIKICIAHCQQYLCEQYTTAVYSSWDVVRKTASVPMAPLDLFCTKCTCLCSCLLVAFDSVMIGFSCILTVHSEVCFQAESVFIDHDGSLYLHHSTQQTWNTFMPNENFK